MNLPRTVLSALASCLSLALVLSSTAFAAEKEMSMQDFKALGASGRDREVLRSADLVKPSERNADWEAIVTKSAKALLKDVNDEDRSWTFEVGQALTKENPHLLKDAEFAYDVGFAGVRSFSSKAVATPFFAAALKPNDERCSVTEVKDAVSDAFTRPGFEKEKVAAKKIAFELCSKKLDDEWVQAMVDNETGLKTGCEGLTKLGKLKGVKATKCKNMKG